MQAVHAGDRKDEEKALSLLHIEFSHGGELFCACRIKAGPVSVNSVDGTIVVSHLENDLLSVNLHLLPVAILDRRIIAFDPYILHELCCEAALAHTT